MDALRTSEGPAWKLRGSVELDLRWAGMGAAVAAATEGPPSPAARHAPYHASRL